jgi:branched-chain amino acid transport system ATP-binding protein
MKASASPILFVSDLRVSYGRIEAVRGVTLAVNKGEFIGVIGSNGAGKTSMLRAIAGVLRPAGGSVSFEGADTTGAKSHQMVARGLAMVPEGRMVFADQTVRDNLVLGAYSRIASDPKGVEEDIEKTLELFPRLKERITQQAGTLSGGEQQMLAIARGLLSRPRQAMPLRSRIAPMSWKMAASCSMARPPIWQAMIACLMPIWGAAASIDACPKASRIWSRFTRRSRSPGF